MKITGVETFLASKPFAKAAASGAHVHRARDIILIRVHTDDGVEGEGFLTGLGFAAGSEAPVIQAIIEQGLAPLLTGKDPTLIEQLWDLMYQETERFGRKGAALRALSGVDMALWDLLGKRVQTPLSRLLGGYRTRIPVYASGGYYYEQGGDALLREEVHSYIESGYRAVKMKIGRASVTRDMERIALVRETIGPDVKLMVDVNGAWDLNTALKAAKRLEEYDIFWLEEPLPPDQVDEMGILAHHTSIAIAAGENEYTRFGFRDLIVRGGVRVIQADVTRVGGITEWKRVAGLASSYDLPLAPHGVQELHTPLVASAKNGLFVEYFMPTHSLQEFISEVFDFEVPVKGADGMYLPESTRPGLGLQVREDAFREYLVAS